MSASVLRMVLATLLVALMIGAGFAQANDGQLAGPGADELADPVIQEQIAAERQAAEEAEQRRQQPDEIAARQRSRTVYEGLSAEQARQLALERFPDLLAPPPASPLELPSGAEVERYYGTDAALIDPPGADVDQAATESEPGTPTTDPGLVVQSTVPLRAPSEDGALRPVDPSLEDRGSYHEPANAPVEAQLPDELAEGIALPELDLSFAPAGAAAAAPGVLTSADSLFYAELGAGEDTDFLAAATPQGAEALWQLRSARSPEELSLAVELPTDARLEPALGGLGARVVKGEETTAIVTPPLAFDADGQSVPVTMEIAGSRLELAIEHRAGDWKYPLLVDPWWVSYDWTASFWPDIAGWRWEDSCPDPCNRFNQGGHYALASSSFENTYYGQSEYAQWVFLAPPDSYVEYAAFWYQQHGHTVTQSHNDNACTVQGIYDRVDDADGKRWQLGKASSSPAEASRTPYTQCRNSFSYTYVDHLVGDYLGDNGTNDEIGADNNGAVFQLFFDLPWKFRYGAWNLMQRADFYLSDRYNPTFSPSTPDPPDDAWRDDSLPGGGTLTHQRTIGIDDRGLGAKYIDLWVPNAQGGSTLNRQTHPCAGAWHGHCPPSWQHTFNYKLPEGLNTLKRRGWDLRWGMIEDSWQQPIDRSAPQVDVPSGSLYTSRGAIQGQNSYTLDITAHDGSAVSAATKRSGVKRIEVWVDADDNEEPMFSYERPDSDCDLDGGGCPMTMRRIFQIQPYALGEGRHTVSVVAVDKLGHRSPQSAQQFQIQVKTDVSLGPLSLSATQPAPDGSYALTATALEDHNTGDRPVSGISYFELLVDGISVETFEPGCPGGGCDRTRTYQMSGSQSLADHHVSVVVYDRAGNGTVEHLGQKRDYYNRFGYGDRWTPKRLKAADRGGANIIRVTIDWCDIAKRRTPPPPGQDPNAPVLRSEWVWDSVSELFANVVARNAENPHDLRVIAILYSSPPWARANPELGCDIVAPPAAQHIRGDNTEWRYFVTEFARRYGPNPRPGEPDYRAARLEAIEIWNEPNLPKFWGGGFAELQVGATQTYADLVNVGSSAVDSVSVQDLDVLPGAMSPIPPPNTYMEQGDFMRRATQEVARPIAPSRIDGTSIHLYADRAMNEPDAVRKVNRRYNRLIASLGETPFANRPRWITEIGFPSNPAVVQGQGERTQRERLHEAYIRFARKDMLHAFIIHRLVDEGDAEKQYGVLQEDTHDPPNDCKRRSIYRKLAELRGSEDIQCPPTE